MTFLREDNLHSENTSLGFLKPFNEMTHRCSALAHAYDFIAKGNTIQSMYSTFIPPYA